MRNHKFLFIYLVALSFAGWIRDGEFRTAASVTCLTKRRVMDEVPFD